MIQIRSPVSQFIRIINFNYSDGVNIVYLLSAWTHATAMGMTANLKAVHVMIIDGLWKEGEPQQVVAECLQSGCVEVVVGDGAGATGMAGILERIVKKAFITWDAQVQSVDLSDKASKCLLLFSPVRSVFLCRAPTNKE